MALVPDHTTSHCSDLDGRHRYKVARSSLNSTKVNLLTSLLFKPCLLIAHCLIAIFLS
ncbi:Uncharacterised protein [Vibrio cholerae]|nr:Uncharacterised protein [Vibrio cholerae]